MPLSTEQILEQLFEELATRPNHTEAPSRRVAIVSTARSGSSLFCDYLRQTGAFGEPREWINMRYMRAWGRVNGRSQIRFNEYWDHIVRKTTTSNGVFSVNFHVPQYLNLKKHGLDIREHSFDAYYYILRGDKLAQAHSLAKAELTDQWSADTAPRQELRNGGPTRTQVFRALVQITEAVETYETDLRPLVSRELSYEDFSSLDPLAAVQPIFADASVHLPECVIHPALSRQRTRADRKRISQLRAFLGPSED